MNKRTRMGVAAVFEAARTQLWNGTEGTNGYTYICTCFGKGRYVKAARKIIQQRLGPFNCLEDWLLCNGVPRRQMTIERVQRHRHEWLNALIKEFSK